MKPHLLITIVLALVTSAATPARHAGADDRSETLDEAMSDLGRIRQLASDVAEAFPSDQDILKSVSTALREAIVRLDGDESTVPEIRGDLRRAILGEVVNLNLEDAGRWTDRLNPIFSEIDGKVKLEPEDRIRSRLAEYYGHVVDVLEPASARTAGNAPIFSREDRAAVDSWERLWQQFRTKVKEESPSLPATFQSNVREYVAILGRILATRYNSNDLDRIKRDAFDATDRFIKTNVVGTRPKKNMMELYSAFVLWVENESGDGDTVEGWQRNLLRMAGELSQFADNTYPAWFREAQQRFGQPRPSASPRPASSGTGVSTGVSGGGTPGYYWPHHYGTHPHHWRPWRYRSSHHYGY